MNLYYSKIFSEVWGIPSAIHMMINMGLRNFSLMKFSPWIRTRKLKPSYIMSHYTHSTNRAAAKGIFMEEIQEHLLNISKSSWSRRSWKTKETKHICKKKRFINLVLSLLAEKINE